ncbi:MAG: tetratricopeptide repeat protein [Alphaproteobacteria bacterium]|nr:tetratricopeptide repeat protein [Alphaproteobacteria bacterium]
MEAERMKRGSVSEKGAVRTGRRGGWIAGLAAIAIVAGCADVADPPVLTAAADEPHAALKVSDFDSGRTAAGNYLAGRHAQRVRDFGSAADYLNKALGADPGNVDLLRRSYRALMADGRIAEATVIAKHLLDQDEATPLASLNLIVGDVKAGNYAAAEARLKDVPQTGLNSFMVPLLTAWVQAGLGKKEEALRALEPLEKLSGFAVMRQLHAGFVAEVAGDRAAAEKSYKEAEKISNGGTLRVVQALGELYERTGRRDEAKALYTRFRDQTPDATLMETALARVAAGTAPPLLVPGAREGMAEAFFNVAGTLVQQNSPEIALIYGWLVLDLRPDFPLAQMMVAGLLENMGRQEEAIEVFKTVKRDSPFGWAARVRTGGALNELERTDEAIALLRTMADEQPGRIEPLVNLGDILRTKKRFEEAAEAYDQAIRRLPTIERRHWSLFYSRGIAYERSKQWPKAEIDFLKALDLSPDQPFVLNYLGYSWVDQGQHIERARKMIERAVELRPNDGYIVDSLGWALYRMNDFEGAVTYLERAIELRPQDPTINDHLGDAYWRVGRVLEARFQWQRALTLEPEPDTVEPLKQKLERGLPPVERDGAAARRDASEDGKKSGL